VAIKVRPIRGRRFAVCAEREARAVSALNHPNILASSTSRDRDTDYLVMGWWRASRPRSIGDRALPVRDRRDRRADRRRLATAHGAASSTAI
jgi:hypothetical protein